MSHRNHISRLTISMSEMRIFDDHEGAHRAMRVAKYYHILFLHGSAKARKWIADQDHWAGEERHHYANER